MLELAERLADLHMKRARIMDLSEKAWIAVREYPTMREKANLYRRAGRVLFAEIHRIEALILETEKL